MEYSITVCTWISLNLRGSVCKCYWLAYLTPGPYWVPVIIFDWWNNTWQQPYNTGRGTRQNLLQQQITLWTRHCIRVCFLFYRKSRRSRLGTLLTLYLPEIKQIPYIPVTLSQIAQDILLRKPFTDGLFSSLLI